MGVIQEALKGALVTATLNSFALDYVARTAVGGSNLNFFILKQLPIPPPSAFSAQPTWTGGDSIAAWMLPRILELTYTAVDMEGFARDLGYDGPPFIWDEARRFWLRAELDAAFFHLYGINRDDVDYIMETFPIVKRKDEKAHGSYRTKEAILEIYDKMAVAVRTGQPYQTALNPPPGPPVDAEGNFIPMAKWDATNWPKHIHRPKERAAT